jgi:hypothetical protein
VAMSEDNLWAGFNKFLRNAPFISKYLEWLCLNANGERIIEGLGNDVTIRGNIHDDQLPLLYALGMPQDKPLVKSVGLGKNYDRRYKDMCVEVFGVEGGIPHEIQTIYETELNRATKPIKLDVMRVPAHIPIPGQYTKTKDGNTFIQVWRIRVFLQNASAFTEELWDGRVRGWVSHIQNIFDPTNPEEIKQLRRLADGFAFGRLTIESSKPVGRPSKESSPEFNLETIPAWSKQYDNAKYILEALLSVRPIKQLARHTEQGRQALIKQAFPGIDNQTAAKLAKLKTVSDVALQYTGWFCSGIEIGTWSDGKYWNMLHESDQTNNRGSRKDTP